MLNRSAIHFFHSIFSILSLLSMMSCQPEGNIINNFADFSAYALYPIVYKPDVSTTRVMRSDCESLPSLMLYSIGYTISRSSRYNAIEARLKLFYPAMQSASGFMIAQEKELKIT